MVQFVTINYGDSPIVAPSRSFDKVCIIGHCTGATTQIKEVHGASDLANTAANEAWLATTDKLYIAALDFFSVNTSGKVILCGLGTAGTSLTDVEFTYFDTDLWMCSYSPLGTLVRTDISIYCTDQVQLDEATPTLTEGWFGVDTTDTNLLIELLNTVPTGKLEVSGAITMDDGDVGTFEYLPNNDGTERIKADLATSAMGDGFHLLTQPSVQFEMFAFAYDQALACYDTPSTETDPVLDATNFKYFASNCLSTLSWLADVQLGGSLATQFNSSGQRTIFSFAIPDGVIPALTIDDDYADGTLYDSGGTPLMWEQVGVALGNNKFIMGFGAKQTASIAAYCPGIAGMGSLSKKPKRNTLTMEGTEITQLEYPDNSEHKQWKDAKINVVVQLDRVLTSPIVWGSNHTFGQSTDGDINFIRCKNIMAYRVETALYNVLLSKPKIKYDSEGVGRIKSYLSAVQKAAIGMYIDGKGTIGIPIQYYVDNEAGLDAGEAAILAAARASKTVTDISFGYDWSGDIEYIIVSYLGIE